VYFGGRGFPSGQRGGTQDPVAKASEGSNPSPRTFRPSPNNGLQTHENLSIQSLESSSNLSLEHFIEYLRDQDYRESTIRTKVKLVRFLRKRVNLWDQDSVKVFIRGHHWHGKRKNNASYAYRNWCLWKGFDYVVEKAMEEDSPLPYIPTETEKDQLIATHNSKYACLLQLLKESAFRIGEAMRLTPDDIDMTRQVITLNKPEKNSRLRQFRMSDRLTAMIKPLIRKTTLNERIWNLKYESLHRTYSGRRKALSKKLGNPKIVKITLRARKTSK
jgi:integrase